VAYSGKARSCPSTIGWSAASPAHAPGIPAGLTAWGDTPHEIEAHFSMLGNGISFVSYHHDHLPNRFVSFVRELAMPVITWTVRDEAKPSIAPSPMPTR
jgi:glycerophosphoryl diester phosphodiesterase